MICAIHQPNFVPYLGFFEKFLLSDVFILYDTAQFSKNDYHNRNRIKTPHGAQWLTVPVHVRLGQPIREVRVADPRFVRSHLQALRANYGKSPFFAAVFPRIEQEYLRWKSGLLVDLNCSLLRYFFELIGRPQRVRMASDLRLDPQKMGSQAIAEMLERVGADTYLSGIGARAYLDESCLAAGGVRVVWQDFKPPAYEQLWGTFLPNLSVLDAIFNAGPMHLHQLIRGIPLPEPR